MDIPQTFAATKNPTFVKLNCHDQESNLSSVSNDSSPEVTNHYPEMTECGRNLNYGFIPRLMAKSVIISYQIYMNLLTNDSIIYFNETTRKEEEIIKIKRKRKNTYLRFQCSSVFQSTHSLFP